MVHAGDTCDTIPATASVPSTIVAPDSSAVRSLSSTRRARIAAMPPLAVMAAKEAVERAFELPLGAGLEFERRNFFGLFASDVQKEGMAAFTEKRAARWRGR